VFELGYDLTLIILGKFIGGDFIAIASEMRRFLASNENTATCTVW
jgi:hypothetical protein